MINKIKIITDKVIKTELDTPEGLISLNNFITSLNLNYTPEIIHFSENTQEIRSRKFICNDSLENPSNLHIDTLGLSSKIIRDSLTNEVISVNHYKSIDLNTMQVSNLAIREVYTNYKDNNNTLIAQKVRIEYLQELFQDDTVSEYIGLTKEVVNTSFFVI